MFDYIVYDGGGDVDKVAVESERHTVRATGRVLGLFHLLFDGVFARYHGGMSRCDGFIVAAEVGRNLLLPGAVFTLAPYAPPKIFEHGALFFGVGGGLVTDVVAKVDEVSFGGGEDGGDMVEGLGLIVGGAKDGFAI